MSLPRPMQLAGQAVSWTLFAVVTGAFAQWPVYSPLPAGHGELKLSMAHLTQRVEPCVQYTKEEMDALPPNMRVPEKCPRARVHAVVQLLLDGEPLLDTAVRPVGLARGGRTYLQANWGLPAGAYGLELKVRDTPRDEGFDKVQHFALGLAAGESVLLDIGDGEARLIPGRKPATTPQE
ncbi:MAG: hypothetical protein ACNA8G_03575 [Gammaproteobacteria bacterium]